MTTSASSALACNLLQRLRFTLLTRNSPETHLEIGFRAFVERGKRRMVRRGEM